MEQLTKEYVELLTSFVRDKVITIDELEGFSENLIDAVKLILSR